MLMYLPSSLLFPSPMLQTRSTPCSIEERFRRISLIIIRIVFFLELVRVLEYELWMTSFFPLLWSTSLTCSFTISNVMYGTIKSFYRLGGKGLWEVQRYVGSFVRLEESRRCDVVRIWIHQQSVIFLPVLFCLDPNTLFFNIPNLGISDIFTSSMQSLKCYIRSDLSVYYVPNTKKASVKWWFCVVKCVYCLLYVCLINVVKMYVFCCLMFDFVLTQWC